MWGAGFPKTHFPSAKYAKGRPVVGGGSGPTPAVTTRQKAVAPESEAPNIAPISAML
jgi:hypothetical protein